MQNPEAYLNAFIHTVEYLSIMPIDVDIYTESSNIITKFFNADIIVFVFKDNNTKAKWLSGHTDTAICETIVTKTQETIRQTFDSGFLTSEVISVVEDTHYSLAFLPVKVKHETTAVMIVSYKTSTPITKDTLNVYLALSGIIGTQIEKREYIESLIKNKEFVENVLNSIITDAISIINVKDYTITAINKFFKEEIGLTDSDIIGKTCYQITHNISKPCEKPDHQCPLEDVLKNGKSAIYEHIHYKSDGSKIYVEVCASPIQDSEGHITHIVHVARDITEKKKLQEQLIQAQKMESLGLMAGGIAHDFNNILTVIAGYAGLLSTRLKHDPTLFGYIEQILTASNNAANLTQSLLAFSRKQVIKPSFVSINQVIKGIAKLLKRLIPADIQMNISLCEDELMVYADAHQIEQIVINLVVNARDAMPRGGNILIKTSTFQAKLIQGHNVPTGSYMLITVADTGEGMDEETLKHIYEPFFTTKAPGKGTGLGLATVYGIVKQHNGHINVYSEKDRGSTFEIYLPTTDGKKDMSNDTVKVIDKQSLIGNETVLISDDDALIRDLLRETLTEYGYNVIESANGVEAISRFFENPQDIKILILDLIMPGKNGKEVYEAIKTLNPKIEIIFMSGYPQDILSDKDLYNEGYEFIAKPLDMQTLLQKIRQTLDKKRSGEDAGLS